MANSIDIVVPDLGDFSDVEIIEVLVSAGDSVAREDGLVTLETDKASMDVPAPASGVVETLTVSVGEKINTGDVIGTMSVEAGAPAEAPSAAAVVDMPMALGDDDALQQQPPPDVVEQTAPPPLGSEDENTPMTEAPAADAVPESVAAVDGGGSAREGLEAGGAGALGPPFGPAVGASSDCAIPSAKPSKNAAHCGSTDAGSSSQRA